jgi:hypothetical protein
MKIRKAALLMTLALLAGIMPLTSQVIATPRTGQFKEQVRGVDLSKMVPGLLNYQGYLADASDSSAVTATLEMTFRLYDDEMSGTEMWSETHPAVEVAGGMFQVQLGSVTPFPAGLFDGTTLWLQTEVGPEALAPRKPITSVAYSQYAGRAEWADFCLLSVVDSAGVADNAYHLEDQALTDLDDRWVNEEDLDHLDATDGFPANAVYVDDAGRVGIGTTSPVTELEVNGAVTAATYWGDGSNLTGISGTADADWTVVGDDMYSAISGNVGIGRTNPAQVLDSPGPVRIGDDAFTFVSTVGLGIIANDATSTSIPLAVLNPSMDHILYAKGDGNVGIGTANPTAPLTIQTTSGRDIEFLSSGNNADIMSTAQMNVGTTGIQSVNLMTNGFYRIHVNGSGDVGIGTTSPVTELEVNGAVTADTYWGDGSNLTGIAGAPDADWTVSGDTVYHDTGPVGIGTDSPGYPLHVYDYAGYSPALAGYFHAVGHEFTGTAHAVYAVATTDDEIAYGIYSEANSTFNSEYAGFFNGGDVVVNNGWLGVGTPSPTVMLDVNGPARIRVLPTGPGTDLVADGSGNIMFKSSSRRYKKNIRELELSPETVLDLQPVRFQYKSTGQEDIGLIAEEVDEIAPDLVIHDLQGRPNAVKYDRVTLYLLELAREQQERIERLEDTIRERRD